MKYTTTDTAQWGSAEIAMHIGSLDRTEYHLGRASSSLERAKTAGGEPPDCLRLPINLAHFKGRNAKGIEMSEPVAAQLAEAMQRAHARPVPKRGYPGLIRWSLFAIAVAVLLAGVSEILN